MLDIRKGYLETLGRYQNKPLEKGFLDPNDAIPGKDTVLYLLGPPGSGTTIKDYSANENDGTITGATWKTLESGLWYPSLNGTTDYINCGNDVSIQDIFAGGGTLMWWMYIDPVKGLHRIFEKRVDAGTRGGWLIIYKDLDSNKLSLTTFDSTNFTEGVWTDNQAIAATTWTHCAMTYDKDLTTNDPIFYVLGVAGTPTENTTPVTGITDVGANLHIGMDVDALNRPFGGGIVLVRAFTEIKSARFIQGVHHQERHLFGV
ncbi:hypothetical protein LCGC14_1138840 [marine sediment metagenome]|uniref:LamG-like jellyroll fold domain-containing protein n=1 Tax=marine sediment metagenome TaxID=412755 RepID=A0A0F9M3Q6_9ZZZZ